MCWLAASCFSMEFQPDSEYPNLRRNGVDAVEIRRSAPERPYSRLGLLVVRDYTGDLRSDNFSTRIRREARKRGAEGAWILTTQLSEQTTFEGSTVATGRGAAHDRHPSGSLRTKVGLVRILLFNYAEKDQGHRTKPKGSRRR